MLKPYFESGGIVLHLGDALETLRQLSDGSIDAVVTDPPYELGFMGKAWDSTGVAFRPDVWRECLRLLKPGGHLLAFGGPRTYHRLACAVEDAGFEIRDQIMWLFAQGFPKSLNLEDEHDGWGTALKPAHEPIVLARRPLETTVAENMVRHGVGALNIDGCRIATDLPNDPNWRRAGRIDNGLHGDTVTAAHGLRIMPESLSPQGRWPADLCHDGSDEVMAAFAEFGEKTSSSGTPFKRNGLQGACYGKRGAFEHEGFYGDSGSAARFFFCGKATKADRDEGLQGTRHDAGDCTGRQNGSAGLESPRAGAGSPSGARNHHCCVKPTALMRWLCRLITPPGGTVLDCFAGSGSTGKAAALEGFKAVLIERDSDYLDIAAGRIKAALQQPRLFETETTPEEAAPPPQQLRLCA